MRFKDTRKKVKKTQTKEIQLRPNIADGDLQVKIKRARGFIENNDRVKVTMTFKGRENVHKDIGMKKIDMFIDSLSDATSISSPIKHDGSCVTVILSPRSKK